MLRRKSRHSEPSAKSRGPHHSGWTLAGLISGIICGLVFGEYCAFLSAIGNAYIGLLQMTVLPFIVVALIANFGRLSLEQSRRLGWVGGVVLIFLWSIGLYTIYLVPHCFPAWKSGSFFSTRNYRTAGHH